ncbi:hypothetical protein F383_35728 [Gossypium arboreum]|uniref:Uncharacterized protein n=1 Tax=Gossypium arboreum TaxID=29729 RepID=A0A0B0NC52_GOSAR|nr:hypothetical protein F383_35728 [Gossypium arboreum]
MACIGYFKDDKYDYLRLWYWYILCKG